MTDSSLEAGGTGEGLRDPRGESADEPSPAALAFNEALERLREKKDMLLAWRWVWLDDEEGHGQDKE